MESQRAVHMQVHEVHMESEDKPKKAIAAISVTHIKKVIRQVVYIYIYLYIFLLPMLQQVTQVI